MSKNKAGVVTFVLFSEAHLKRFLALGVEGESVKAHGVGGGEPPTQGAQSKFITD